MQNIGYYTEAAKRWTESHLQRSLALWRRKSRSWSASGKSFRNKKSESEDLSSLQENQRTIQTLKSKSSVVSGPDRKRLRLIQETLVNRCIESGAIQLKFASSEPVAEKNVPRKELPVHDSVSSNPKDRLKAISQRLRSRTPVTPATESTENSGKIEKETKGTMLASTPQKQQLSPTKSNPFSATVQNLAGGTKKRELQGPGVCKGGRLNALKQRLSASCAATGITHRECTTDVTVDRVFSQSEASSISPRSPAPEVISLQSPGTSLSSQHTERLKTINLRLSGAVCPSPNMQDMMAALSPKHGDVKSIVGAEKENTTGSDIDTCAFSISV